MALITKLIITSLLLLVNHISFADKSFNDEEIEDLLPFMTEQCFVRHNEADDENRFRDKDLYIYCECIIKTVLSADDAKEIFLEIDKGNLPVEVYKDLVNESARNCKEKTPKEI